MRTIYKVKKTVMIFFVCLIVACGVETAVALIFIPAFAATWPVVGDNEYRISLQPDGDNRDVPSGIFEGDEFHDSDQDRNDNFLSGSFNGLDIEFTIERNNGPDVQYIGRMVPVSDTDHTIVRIVLTSSEGNLVLGQ